MARQRYRRVRGSAVAALTAASQPFEPNSKQYKNSLALAGRQGWQTEAWDLLDRVGELRYYVSWRANSCSKVRLIASELNDEGKPTGECSDQDVVDLVNSIGGNQNGAAQFVKRSVECLTVPGETWQGIIVDSKGRERWLAFSTDEFRRVANKAVVTLPTGEDHEIGGDDAIWRTWFPHPRIAKQSDSPVRANLDALREIVRTTATIADVAKSRLLGAGVLFVPTEMSLPAANAPAAADKIGDIAELRGVPAARQLEDLLYDVARTAYSDDESFARMIPIIAAVGGDQIKNVSHLKFDSEFTDQAIKTRNDAIARLALGLDVSPERLLGMGSSTNHWSAWQIGDNDVQMHIAPVMELMCESLTDNLLREALEDMGKDPDDFIVWYDTSELTADPDKSDDATNAFDRGVISADAYRAFLNLGDTGYDLLNGGASEWARWATDWIAKDPANIIRLQPLVPLLKSIEFPEVEAIEATTEATKNPPQADTTNEGNDPDTEGTDPGYDQGKRGRKEDVGKSVDHREAFLRVFVTRALELAGKRRRNVNDRAQGGRLRSYKPHEYHRLMDPVDPEKIPELIRGWDDALEDEVLAIIGVERNDFAALVRAEVRRQLTAQVITV